MPPAVVRPGCWGPTCSSRARRVLLSLWEGQPHPHPDRGILASRTGRRNPAVGSCLAGGPHQAALVTVPSAGHILWGTWLVAGAHPKSTEGLSRAWLDPTVPCADGLHSFHIPSREKPGF